jgi:hypothetical protein
MKDYTSKDIEYFSYKLWENLGIPERYLAGTKNADMLEMILKRRKRLRNLKDIYNIDGKARD